MIRQEEVAVPATLRALQTYSPASEARHLRMRSSVVPLLVEPARGTFKPVISAGKGMESLYQKMSGIGVPKTIEQERGKKSNGTSVIIQNLGLKLFN